MALFRFREGLHGRQAARTQWVVGRESHMMSGRLFSVLGTLNFSVPGSNLGGHYVTTAMARPVATVPVTCTSHDVILNVTKSNRDSFKAEHATSIRFLTRPGLRSSPISPHPC